MQYDKFDDTNTGGVDQQHIQTKDINAGGSVSIEANHLTSGQSPLLTNEAEAARRKKIKWIIFISLIVIVVVLSIVLPLTLIHHDNDNDGHGPLPPGQMNPYGAIPNTAKYDGSGTRFSGYLLADISKKAQLEKKMLAMNAVPQQFLQFLKEQVTQKKVGVDWRNVNFFGPNNQLKANISYMVDVVSSNVARLVLTTGNETRFSIPPQWVQAEGGSTQNRLEMMGLQFFNPANDSFGFKMVDNKDPTNVLLSTMGQTLLFSDKYIQMDYTLPSQYVYGLGDRIHEFRLNEGAFTMWSSGQKGQYDNGKGRGGLSGVHPFLLVQTKNPRIFVGLFFRNANAMTPVLRYNDDGQTSTLSFITIGGQLEVYIFGQGTAHSVIQSYQQFVGLSKLPPFWALGWQEASIDTSIGKTAQESVVGTAKKYLDQGYPLDAVYVPINSWDAQQDFTLDKTQYPNPIGMTNAVNANNQRLVAYLDAAVNVQNRASNPVYAAGKNVDAFVKSTINQPTDGYLMNKKLGKNVVYVDWLNGQASDFWSRQVGNYQKALNFDGLWTTMNEPYGDVAGELSSSQLLTNEHLLESIAVQGGEETPYDQSWFYSFWPLNKISTYFLPFIPELKTVGNYDANTLSLNGTHLGNAQDYDVHSLYPLGMANATLGGLAGDSRPFMLTKGSFSGISRFTGAVPHTDNDRSWASLYYGLQSTLRSQMFGMPLSGSDVCGYTGNQSGTIEEELCLRWYQMATFFPLARHSQDSNGPRTDPFNFKTKAAAVKKTMHDRMQYLRLMYTCLFQASDSGNSCLSPLQFRFPVPTSQWTAGSVHTNSYLFAGSLLVSPIVNDTKGAATFKAYIPAANGSWVNMADWTEVVSGTNDVADLKVRDTVNVHIAPGSIIPFQNNQNMQFNTTKDVLAAPIQLIINRDWNGAAGGSLFLDQGISQQEMQNKNYDYYNIQAQAKSIQFQPSRYNKGTQPHLIDSFVIVNAKDLNETSFACFFAPDSLEPQGLDKSFDDATNALILTPRSPLKFSQVLNVYYGSATAKDLNVCDSHTFAYNIQGGAPDITGKKSVTLTLNNMAGTLPDITFTIGFLDSGVVNMRYTWADPSGKRDVFGVPQSLVNTTAKDPSMIPDTLDKHLNITDKPFQVNFNVKLTSPQAEPYLIVKGLLFHEYLNWIKVVAYAEPAASEQDFRGVFGLGERASTDFFFKNGVYSMWAKDIDNPWETGRLPGNQVYGVHPFYMFKHSSKSWVGVYHNNAQAQDWWITNNWAAGNISLQTIATGGLGDIYVFTSAQKPEGIIAKYHAMIGSPVLVPQWALGWNQCRWCYQNAGDVRQSAQGYAENKIPLDTQWVDIDYMQDYKDFTYNAKDNAGNAGSFAGLPQLVTDLHAKNMKFVPIIDAGISYRPGQQYPAFTQGMAQDVFMKANGNILIGKVWPNEAVYPDFTHPNAPAYWQGQLDSFQGQLSFDGLWQDMNEASNFCSGTCDGTQVVSAPVSEKLPYTPTGESLETKTISLDVQHANGMLQLDAHSLFGALQVQTSSSWFIKNNKRPMIISRSSFAGMGKYGSTWLGDNHATVKDMEASVLSIMNMNIFGIPLTGADICGFGGESTTAELCTRWHAVGAFYPFSRNHRACWGNAQEAWRFNTTQFDATHNYTDLMRESINRKYSLMRYYYTQMTQMALGNNTFYMMYKPLFFEFPDDRNTYQDLANNVMIGPALKTSVNARSITDLTTPFYFPAGTWCSLFENVGECIYNEIGQNVTLPSNLNESYAHLREGFIIPMQNAVALAVQTTVDLQQAPIDLHILGSVLVPGFSNWRAEGTYLNDDGVTTNLQGNVNQYRFTAAYVRRGDGSEEITITVGQVLTATNHLNPATNCSSVNMADFLQSIYIYNASSFSQHNTYWVSVAYLSDINDYVTLGQAVYDMGTNRILFDNSVLQNLVCLTYVFRISIKNLSPVPTTSAAAA